MCGLLMRENCRIQKYMRTSIKVTSLLLACLGIAVLLFVNTANRNRAQEEKIMHATDTNAESIMPNAVDREIDYVWSQMHAAKILERQGKLVDAATYYKNGFYGLTGDMDRMIPGRSMCGNYLVNIYETLGEYDKALETLDILEARVFKGRIGKKRASDIRARLLAAKGKVPIT
jgi:tetratricopeptide (TPR) repeat protein